MLHVKEYFIKVISWTQIKEADLLFQGLQPTFLQGKVYVIGIIKTALTSANKKNDAQSEQKHLSK